MLDEGFAILSGSSSSRRRGERSSSQEIVQRPYDGELAQRTAETLCGNVWMVADEMMKFSSSRSSSSSSPNLGDVASEEPNPWRSLALDAQRCLGGAGLAFLIPEDGAYFDDMLRVSTKIFKRLVSIAPFRVGGLTYIFLSAPGTSTHTTFNTYFVLFFGKTIAHSLLWSPAARTYGRDSERPC